MGPVIFFPTCVVDTVAPQVGVAAVRVLRRLGCEVRVPAAATCCGQPAWNAGFAADAARVAATTLDALGAAVEAAGWDAVVCVPAGSCATMIRIFWPELFHLTADHGRAEAARELRTDVREFSELVAERGGAQVPAAYDKTVAYHHSCHMLRELSVRDAPVDLLESLDGCTVARWTGDERCCGFGGTFSVKQPELSVAMADDKLDSLAETDAAELIGCDQSCLMHLEGRLARRGEPTPVRHLAEVLDDAQTVVGELTDAAGPT